MSLADFRPLDWPSSRALPRDIDGALPDASVLESPTLLLGKLPQRIEVCLLSLDSILVEVPRRSRVVDRLDQVEATG